MAASSAGSGKVLSSANRTVPTHELAFIGIKDFGLKIEVGMKCIFIKLD